MDVTLPSWWEKEKKGGAAMKVGTRNGIPFDMPGSPRPPWVADGIPFDMPGSPRPPW